MIKVDEGKIKEVLGRAGLSTRRQDEIARLLGESIRNENVVEVIIDKPITKKFKDVSEVIKKKEE